MTKSRIKPLWTEPNLGNPVTFLFSILQPAGSHHGRRGSTADLEPNGDGYFQRERWKVLVRSPARPIKRSRRRLRINTTQTVGSNPAPEHASLFSPPHPIKDVARFEALGLWYSSSQRAARNTSTRPTLSICLPISIKSRSGRSRITLNSMAWKINLTLAVQSEFNRDGRYQITSEEQADGIVIGDITRYLFRTPQL